MDHYQVFDQFNITPLIEQYEGLTIEELYPNHQIVNNSMGQFMEIIWENVDIPQDLNLKSSKKSLIYNLKTVYHIGDYIEKRLKSRGVKSLYDLKHMIKYGKPANELLKFIKEKDYNALLTNQCIYDIDTSFCFNLKDFLFLDIETLDLYDSPMIIVGLGYFTNSSFEIHILYARDVSEEIAICEHLKDTVFPKFKSFVTFNGRSFDIPYMANRFLYYNDHNPMIKEQDKPYDSVNTIYHHIDLYHNCRRKFKGLFEKYSLTNMEEKLLGFKRENEMPSSLIGLSYRKYLQDPHRYVGLMKECIDHNYFDVYSMPLILQKLFIKK
ncbi:MAG: ribonuclease H-like domain-containing protein [Candidatus Lokiarchaeota archaeon]|nr:ribonuclease H-like domain-containing protein [Candidatus Lokiarchaeota archaeon]